MEYYIILLPGLIYVFLGLAHYLNYRNRRYFVGKWMQNEEIQKAYFYYLWEQNPDIKESKKRPKSNKDITDLLNRTVGHNWISYWFAFLITFIVLTIISYFTFSHFIFTNFLNASNELYIFFKKDITSPVYFAAIGAFLWGFYDFLMRYRNQNWTAVQQHIIWLKIPLAMIICHFIFLGKDNEIDNIIAFGIGAFPIDSLRKFIVNTTTTKIGIMEKSITTSPKWESINGITQQVVDKFEEFGIENVHQLASADPFKLHFNSNIELIALLDFIDQALMLFYVGEDKARILKSMGITGAIDLGVLMYRNEELRKEISICLKFDDCKQIEESSLIFKNILQNIFEDARIQLIWRLWNLSSQENNVNNTDMNEADEGKKRG